MKNKKFQPIVMPCTKEQYNSLIPILNQNNIEYCPYFHKYANYIVNDGNFIPNKVAGIITTTGTRNIKSKFYKRFNRKIFLASLGIVEEPEFVLPRFWYIRVTNENIDVIKTHRNINAGFMLKPGCVVGHSKSALRINDIGYDFEENSNNLRWVNEITLEQFKKYVLKQDDILESQSVTNKQSNTIMKSTVIFEEEPSVEYKKGMLVRYKYDYINLDCICLVSAKNRSGNLHLIILHEIERPADRECKVGNLMFTDKNSKYLSPFYGEINLKQ